MTTSHSARKRDAVHPYDFRRPSKLSREHARALQNAFETFARQGTTLLTTGLRQVCQLTLNGISQQSYDEYISSLDGLTLLMPLALNPLNSTGILEFSLPVALAAVDHTLGGPGGEQAARELTDIETTLIRGLLNQMVSVLKKALEPVVPLAPEIIGIEYNPQFVQAAGNTDPMVVGDFTMTVGSQECRATLCLPLGPLLPRMATQRQPGSAQTPRDPATLLTVLRERLGNVPLTVSVGFDDIPLPSQRILALAEGDVIIFPHRHGEALNVSGGGLTFAKAVAGKSGKTLAALIVDPTQESSTP